MSFIFKLLKFPFSFDCSLKLLHISLAQWADRVHFIKQIFKPFCFWASSLSSTKKVSRLCEQTSEARKIKNYSMSFLYGPDEGEEYLGLCKVTIKWKHFDFIICFISLHKASSMPSGCRQIGCLHQNVRFLFFFYKTIDVQDAENAETSILMPNPSEKYSSAVSV